MAAEKSGPKIERQFGVRAPDPKGREECSYQAPARKPDEGKAQGKPDPKPSR